MRRVLTVTWSVLLVLGLLAAGWLWLDHHHTTERDRAGEAALATARASITTLLSYRGTGLTGQLASKEHLLTPSYAGAYRGMVLQQVAPTAKSAHAQVTASVVAGGVMSASTARAVTLLYVDLTTHTSTDATPVTTGSRLRVTLRDQDGTWLIDDIEPL